MTEGRARQTKVIVDRDIGYTDHPAGQGHAAAVIPRKTGNARVNSRGGTTWVGRRGSQVLPVNQRLAGDDTPPFDGGVMVNRRSQSVKDLAPMDTLDDMNLKNKSPWWDTGNEIKPINIGDWPASGPQRPSLRLRTFDWRKGSQPNSNGYGMHTNIDFSDRTLAGHERMRRPQQDKLTVQRYRGQSFSSTTVVLGGR